MLFVMCDLDFVVGPVCVVSIAGPLEQKVDCKVFIFSCISFLAVFAADPKTICILSNLVYI